MIKTNCKSCGKPLERRPDRFKGIAYCDANCLKEDRRIKLNCVICGKPFTRAKCYVRPNPCCSLKCGREFTSRRFTELNPEFNKDKMTPEVREKLRHAKLNTGEGVSYEKTYGRHTHRVVAEKILGRPLKKGEVVHHCDGNIRNNAPENLIILESQATHARLHKKLEYAKQKRS